MFPARSVGDAFDPDGGVFDRYSTTSFVKPMERSNKSQRSGCLGFYYDGARPHPSWPLPTLLAAEYALAEHKKWTTLRKQQDPSLPFKTKFIELDGITGKVMIEVPAGSQAAKWRNDERDGGVMRTKRLLGGKLIALVAYGYEILDADAADQRKSAVPDRHVSKVQSFGGDAPLRWFRAEATRLRGFWLPPAQNGEAESQNSLFDQEEGSSDDDRNRPELSTAEQAARQVEKMRRQKARALAKKEKEAVAELRAYVVNGDVPAVQHLLRQRSELINEQLDTYGQTALILAATGGRTLSETSPMVSALLGVAGIEVDARCTEDFEPRYTALFAAAFRREAPEGKLSDSNIGSSQGEAYQRPLSDVPASDDQLKTIRMLVEAGADKSVFEGLEDDIAGTFMGLLCDELLDASGLDVSGLDGPTDDESGRGDE